MKITDVRTVLLTGPSTGDRSVSAFRSVRSAAFVEVLTDTEVVGIGETYLGYFMPELVPALVDFFKPILVGADPSDVHVLRRRMVDCCAYWGRVGIGPAVISGIEAALWDLKGKAHGLPVFELLGGSHHDSLLAYATGGPSNWPEDRLLAKVDAYLGLGFTAFKIGTGYFDETTGQAVAPATPTAAAELEAAKIELLRGHVGREVRILLDGHMGFTAGPERWELPTATAVLKHLEPYDVFLFEEPLAYTDPVGYAELRRSTAIPVAGGESLTTLEEFRRFADLDAFGVAQPDAAWVGGLSEFVAVGRLFAARNRWVASHAWGAGGAVMQNLHAAFATPNTLIVEIPPAAGPLHHEIWGESFQMRDGRVLLPATPGLGVGLSETVKERFPFVPRTGEFVSVPGKVLGV
ncbi:MAG TPA: mandelate racemase/muconate lactonizing enzyme family protein [Thermomicrobiales bacterium]|nr:mandelate racemase/muconate lactonizing enzyme family protein [Thermomicrobiales bacterium]